MAKSKSPSTPVGTTPLEPNNSGSSQVAIEYVEWCVNEGVEGVVFAYDSAQTLEFEQEVTLSTPVPPQSPFTLELSFIVNGKTVNITPLRLEVNNTGTVSYVSGTGWKADTGAEDTFIFGTQDPNFSATITIDPGDAGAPQDIILVGTIPIGDNV